MGKHPIKIGVRDTRLGRIVGEKVIELLKPRFGSAACVIVPVGHSAERGRANPKRWPGILLEQALLDGEIDIAVQNMKNIPPDPLPGIVLAAVLERVTPFDVLIARDGTIMDELPDGSAVSAHSPIRRSQLRNHILYILKECFPDFII